MRVLVAEDHDRLARAVAAGLRRRGMTADVALDGGEALDRLAVSSYDVVVLDRDLPGVHGDEICRRLAAERSASRILMLTAARSVRDRVEGLGLGAADHRPKPFDFTELVARTRALARRPGVPPPAGLAYRDLSMDPVRRVAVGEFVRLREHRDLRRDGKDPQRARLDDLFDEAGRVGAGIEPPLRNQHRDLPQADVARRQRAVRAFDRPAGARRQQHGRRAAPSPA